MITHEVPEALVDWEEDMLADRNLTVNHGDTTIVGKPDKGPHGGSSVSTFEMLRGKRPLRASTKGRVSGLWLCR